MIAAGHDGALVYDVLNRVEAPPTSSTATTTATLIISRNAIGISRRHPVTHRYRRHVLRAVERAAKSN